VCYRQSLAEEGELNRLTRERDELKALLDKFERHMAEVKESKTKQNKTILFLNFYLTPFLFFSCCSHYLINESPCFFYKFTYKFITAFL
jgi:hypothetical protein